MSGQKSWSIEDTKKFCGQVIDSVDLNRYIEGKFKRPKSKYRYYMLVLSVSKKKSIVASEYYHALGVDLLPSLNFIPLMPCLKILLV